MLSQEKTKMKNIEKNAQNLERYEIIVNYFSQNKDRIPVNTNYLIDLNRVLMRTDKKLSEKLGALLFPLERELYINRPWEDGIY